jgi:hypothetical protein
MPDYPMTAVQQVQQRARDVGAARSIGGPLIIPKSAIPFMALGAVPCPALGVQVEVCSYQVQPQWFAFVWGVVLQFSGAPLPNPTDVIWSVDVNRPVGETAQGYAEKDFGSIVIPLGSSVLNPWPVDFRHWSKEVIRIKGTPIANVTPGAPNFVIGILLGHTWPGQEWEGV